MIASTGWAVGLIRRSSGLAARQRSEFHGAPALALCFCHAGIPQLNSFAHASKQQAAATHVAASDKFGGKHQAGAKLTEQRFHIFGRCDATKEHDFTVVADCAGKKLAIPL